MKPHDGVKMAELASAVALPTKLCVISANERWNQPIHDMVLSLLFGAWPCQDLWSLARPFNCLNETLLFFRCRSSRDRMFSSG